MKIHCVCCRKNFDSKDEETKRDGGFESHRCPLCGYENVTEPKCDLANGSKDGDPN